MSVTLVLGLVGSAFYVFAEPTETQAEEPETTVAEYEEETSPDTSAVDSQPIDTPLINIPIEDVDVSDISENMQATSSTNASSEAETTAAYEKLRIPDGIYAIRSCANDQRWIDIQGNSTLPGKHVQQHSFGGISPAEQSNKPSGLFRFTYVEETDSYIIRLMLNNNLTFSYDGSGNVITKIIDQEDANVSANDTFVLIKRDYGLLLKAYSAKKYISSQDANASGAADAPDSYLIAADNLQGYRSIWFLEGYETIIEDGVYCFENASDPYSTSSLSSLWIDTRGNSTSPGAIMQQSYCSPMPAESFTRSALFKISRVPNTDRYIIRSMLNNTLSFGISGDKIISKTIPDVDANVLAADTFRIRCYGNAFLIQPYGSSYVIASNGSSASGSAGAPNSDLCHILKPTTEDRKAMWHVYKYTGSTRKGCNLDYPSSWKSEGFVVGETGDMSISTWSTVINANKPYIEILPEYADLATYSYNANTHTVTLTATNPGRLQIETCILLGDSTDDYSYQGGYARFYIVPQEGTYYIQNAGSGRYIDVEGPSLNDGAAIHEWDFRTNPQEKWIVEHVANSDGYIRLKSVYSNKYIGVDSANTTLIKQYAAQNNYTLWRIDRTTSGNITFKCKVSESTTSVLAVPSSSNVSGTNLRQVAYVDEMSDFEYESYLDEWYLIEKVISYVNYYDSSFAASSVLLQNIPIANRFANLVYSKYFNVGMYMDGAASQYATVIDSCTTGINSQCSSTICGSDCNTSHHKNGLVVSNQLYYDDREDDHIYVLWTDRAEKTYCNESSNQHTPVGWIAVVYNDRPVIHFMTIYGNENVELACMTLNMVHETAHTLKMDDVYNDPGHDKNNATVCVMEKFDLGTAYEFYIDVLNNRAEPFCASCRSQLEGYTSNISILGN